jgi:SAM-dependent MidA family methyltransferase
MGSTLHADAAPSPAFLDAFQQHADARARMSFAEFMQLALYHPTLGYYAQPRQRVGYGEGTDFYTASTSAPVFGELVVAAAAHLLSERGAAPAEYTFVEIGAEPSASVLAGVSHPFAGSRCLRLGEPVALSGRCVVFSNELFDAQPCARYVRTTEGWAEIYIERVGPGLREVLQPIDSPPAGLPPSAPVGYHFDAPRAAAELGAVLAQQPWQGLFVAFDYGKTLQELAEECPAGTARAYFRHRQSTDLLARPGEQDLTCHVCWDWLAQALAQHGFDPQPVLSQEAFLVKHASAALARMMASEASQLSRRKLAVMQLLHPAHLGQKFQVLSAWRADPAASRTDP